MSEEEKDNDNPTADEVVAAWREHTRDALRPFIVFVALLATAIAILMNIEQAMNHIGAIMLIYLGVIVLNNVFFISSARKSRQRFIDLKSSYDYHHPPQEDDQ